MTTAEQEKLRGLENRVKEQEKAVKKLNEIVWQLHNNPVRRLSKRMRTEMLKTIKATVIEQVKTVSQSPIVKKD